MVDIYNEISLEKVRIKITPKLIAFYQFPNALLNVKPRPITIEDVDTDVVEVISGESLKGNVTLNQKIASAISPFSFGEPDDVNAPSPFSSEGFGCFCFIMVFDIEETISETKEVKREVILGWSEAARYVRKTDRVILDPDMRLYINQMVVWDLTHSKKDIIAHAGHPNLFRSKYGLSLERILSDLEKEKPTSSWIDEGYFDEFGLENDNLIDIESLTSFQNPFDVFDGKDKLPTVYFKKFADGILSLSQDTFDTNYYDDEHEVFEKLRAHCGDYSIINSYVVNEIVKYGDPRHINGFTLRQFCQTFDDLRKYETGTVHEQDPLFHIFLFKNEGKLIHIAESIEEHTENLNQKGSVLALSAYAATNIIPTIMLNEMVKKSTIYIRKYKEEDILTSSDFEWIIQPTEMTHLLKGFEITESQMKRFITSINNHFVKGILEKYEEFKESPYEILIKLDLFSNMEYHIFLPEVSSKKELFMAPIFCSSIYSPLYTVDKNKLEHLKERIRDIITQIVFSK